MLCMTCRALNIGHNLGDQPGVTRGTQCVRHSLTYGLSQRVGLRHSLPGRFHLGRKLFWVRLELGPDRCSTHLPNLMTHSQVRPVRGARMSPGASGPRYPADNPVASPAGATGISFAGPQQRLTPDPNLCGTATRPAHGPRTPVIAAGSPRNRSVSTARLGGFVALRPKSPCRQSVPGRNAGMRVRNDDCLPRGGN
jgi:hypothetical protein